MHYNTQWSLSSFRQKSVVTKNVSDLSLSSILICKNEGQYYEIFTFKKAAIIWQYNLNNAGYSTTWEMSESIATNTITLPFCDASSFAWFQVSVAG